jgi:hypothetical protein
LGKWRMSTLVSVTEERLRSFDRFRWI